MTEDEITTTEETTRRDYVKYGGAVVGGGLLAGCTGDTADEPQSTPTENETAETQNETEGSDATGDSDESTADAGYAVDMASVGEVAFDAAPETWESYFPGYADMGVALGRAAGLTAVGFKSRYHTECYDGLDGVSDDKSEITQLYDEGIDKELYYELDSDVHPTDPQWLLNNSFFWLSESDVAELIENVAPFIGNTTFRRTDEWHTYRYYTMYEAFEKVAEVFQEGERFQAFESLHDEFLARVHAELPAADARLAGLLCFAGSDEPEAFSPYRLTDKGTNKKHFRDLGVSDALSGAGRSIRDRSGTCS